MKQEIQIIKVYPFLKPYKRQKDGLQQVMVRVRLGSKNKGKTSILKTIDIPLFSENEEIIRLTKQQFDNRKNENGVMLRYYEVIGLLNKGIFILSKEGFEINTKLLFKLVYSKTNKENDEDEKLIENEDVKKIFGHPVPEKVWESFISQTYTDELTGEPVLFEELEDIATSIESEYYHQKRQEEIDSMDFNKRYKEGYYDKTNIFHCLGYCWSNDEKNNEPLIPESYKGLLLRLHDYRFNENPSEHAKDFNEKWIDDFLRFLAQEGYSAFAPRSYHPFNLEKYRIKFIKAERRPYRYAGFEKIVKHLKRYVFLLQKHKIIEYNRNPKFIDAKDYVGRKVLTTPYTRREHSLTKDEFELLASTDFRNEKLNTARDMFILAVIGGGFRGEELYNHELEVEKRMGKYVIHIFHSKTSSQNSNPVFGALHEVIERNKGKLPNFLPREEFRASLKEIAQKLKLNRTIISPNTFLNAKEKQTKEVLKDIFSIYFARKTMVTILTAYGIPDEKIIEFTAHSKTSTLKHYKAELSLSDKFKIINSLMEQPRQ